MHLSLIELTLFALLILCLLGAVIRLTHHKSKATKSIQSLEARLQSATSDYQHLKDELTKESLERQTQSKDFQSLQIIIQTLEAKNGELLQKINSLSSGKTSSEIELSTCRERLKSANEQLIAITDELSDAKHKLERLNDIENASAQLETLRAKISVFEEEHELIAAGLYPVSLDFETPDELKKQLDSIREELAAMIRTKTAAICNTKWTINGSSAEGTRATRHYIRIMLRTFNADADACLDLVRWNNLEKCEQRLRTSFDYVNELGSTHSTFLQEQYLNARLSQIRLMHRYRESVYRQKEAMRAARQAALEERKANREIERARQEAEAEERRYAKALARAREDVLALVGVEREHMLRSIAELEQKLSDASLLKQRAISMAQITKAGFVYVVSNIGSFGPNVLKIGMTRRIDPKERIRELGGASVPFHFDVHAMIYSENAPELENAFHRRFSISRLNLANGRKEFFRVPLDSVIEFANELSLGAEFSRQPEARDFRISNQLRTTLSEDEIGLRLMALEQAESSVYDEESSEDSEIDEPGGNV